MLKEVTQTYEKEIRSRTGSVARLFPGLHYHVQWITIVAAPVFIWISGASRLFMLVPIGAWLGSWAYFHFRGWRWLQAGCSRYRIRSDASGKRVAD
jgi:hypothetical protein